MFAVCTTLLRQRCEPLETLFFPLPPQWKFNGPHPRQIDPAPNGNDLGHSTIKIRNHRFDARDDLCQ